jgi:hypothetical protein
VVAGDIMPEDRRYVDVSRRGLFIASSALHYAEEAFGTYACHDWAEQAISTVLELLMSIKEKSPSDTIWKITDELMEIRDKMKRCLTML